MEHATKLDTARRLEHYPGYPTVRLTYELTEYAHLQHLHIPDGPWEINNTALPNPDDTRLFEANGYATDTQGRPIHPWAQWLLSSEYGGMVTGKGAYWHWGPNHTADPIVITNEPRPQILLIERADTGALALPGGFVDKNEPAHDCAVRELREETGLSLMQPGKLVYRGPVADIRTTLHAWAETSAYVFIVDGPQAVTGNDDAISANWYFIDKLPNTLFGSHATLVKMALKG